MRQIHYLSENIRCAGAGTAADTEFTSECASLMFTGLAAGI